METAQESGQAAMLCTLWLCCLKCAESLTQMTAAATCAVLHQADALIAECHQLCPRKLQEQAMHAGSKHL